MKSVSEMDLQEWEVLSDDGFLEISDDGGGNKIYSRSSSPSSPTLFHMNYFICPPKTPPPNHPLPAPPIDLEPHDHQLPVEINMKSETIKSFQQDAAAFSQVFFKKMKEAEFVDIKVESPKSSSSRGMMPQLDFQGSDDSVTIGKDGDHSESEDDEDEGGFNIWKRSFTGIGAICSFGVAAATFCIITFTTQRINHQKLSFQIYTNDKRMKEVVQHATKLKEAISGVRGVAVTRAADITYGGYYDAASSL